MVSSEVEKIFRAFTEKRKAELPRFTPDGIPITLENKFDDAIYHYLYEYWKTNSGEYDPKKDVIPESEMNKMHPKTKNEFQFEKWLFEQYGMTKKEEREYTVKGNLLSLGEIAEGYFTITGIGDIKKGIAYLAANKISKETLLKAFLGQTDDMVENTIKKEIAEEATDNIINNGIVQSRINIANGQTRFTPIRPTTGKPVSAGFNHILNGHFNRPLGNSRSIFSISPDELKVILQSKHVVQSQVKIIPGGQYVRTVDTGKVIGNTALKFGGDETTWIQIFTDKAGNLITAYPVPAPF